MHHQRCTRQWMRFDDLRPMYDACMRGAGRMICKRADGGDWIIFSLSEAHYHQLSMVLILFARYAADSNAMPCNDDLHSRIFKARTSFIPLRRWVEAVIWYWSHSRIKSATSNINSNQDAACAYLISLVVLTVGRRSVAFWKALEVLYRLGV